jgi:hypothetical protein
MVGAVSALLTQRLELLRDWHIGESLGRNQAFHVDACDVLSEAIVAITAERKNRDHALSVLEECHAALSSQAIE